MIERSFLSNEPSSPSTESQLEVAPGVQPESKALPDTVSLKDDDTGTAAPQFSGSSGLRYRPLRFHAKGGLGEVHLAHDQELHRDVALKRVQERHHSNLDSRRRFLLEAEITAKLEHPGVVPVYGLVQDDAGQPCYAMRFIEGDTLRDAIKRFHDANASGRDPHTRGLELRQLLARFIAVCNTVAYAHSRGILHRDLKPANVMLGKYGETWVVDWGLAKIIDPASAGSSVRDEATQSTVASESCETEAGQVLGTRAYMSPEQAAGRIDHLGPATDIYSLGAILFELLTGQKPLPDSNAASKGGFAPSAMPPALGAVCRKAMAVNPEDRYSSALSLAADVESWLADEPVSAHREPLGLRLARWRRRHRLLVNSLSVLFLTGVVALAVSTVFISQARDKAEYRFEQAQNAVKDYLVTVTKDDQLKSENLMPLRRRLLDKGLAYYQDFLNERSNDPELRGKYASAQLRTAFIQQQIGAWDAASEAYDGASCFFDSLSPSGRTTGRISSSWRKVTYTSPVCKVKAKTRV